MLSIILQTIIILLALTGLGVAAYIYHKKSKRKQMVCPLNAHCDPVINSEFAKFLGVPVEILGMLYYGLIAISYLILTALPALKTAPVSFVMLAITTAAFLFSLYLTFIQAVAIKNWCSWCLFSASLCTGIFGLVAWTASGGIIATLAEVKGVLLAIHLLGLVLGLGGATITDLFFFHFLKDFRISQFEANVMNKLSQVIWLGLAILIVSGIGLYLPQAETLNESVKFLTKMTVVSVIVINGAFLNLVISPRLVSITFGKDHEHYNGELKRFRRLAFALGAISFTSWYSAFVLGLLRYVPLSLPLALSIYFGLLAAAVGGSQVMERLINRSAS